MSWWSIIDFYSIIISKWNKASEHSSAMHLYDAICWHLILLQIGNKYSKIEVKRSFLSSYNKKGYIHPTRKVKMWPFFNVFPPMPWPPFWNLILFVASWAPPPQTENWIRAGLLWDWQSRDGWHCYMSEQK